MTVFKSAHTLDKQVENCHICLEINSCNLIFILKYKSGVNKSHLSPILEPEKLQVHLKTFFSLCLTFEMQNLYSFKFIT